MDGPKVDSLCGDEKALGLANKVLNRRVVLILGGLIGRIVRLFALPVKIP